MFENKYCKIENKVSGHNLLAGSWGTDPGDRKVHQYPLSETGKNPDGFQWQLKKNGTSFQIINKVSGHGLLAGSWGTDPGDRKVHQYPLSETGDNPNGFLWKIENCGDVPYDLKTKEGTGENEIGDVDRIKSFGQPPKKTTVPVVIGEVLLPFFTVQDDSNKPAYQVKNNPFYRFKREGYWQRIFFYEHDGATSKTKKESIKVGLVETSSKTIEDTMSITVSAQASFSYGGASTSMTSSISNQLKVTTVDSTEKMQETTREIEETFDKGKKFVRAIWMRADRFTLSSLTGTMITTFEQINPQEITNDSFPD